ncbi:hypothetical protein CPB84DRAFT_1963550 [Gymnopilus junonius]|uniref:Uncharacterized protein n=1 Tax=Gymnopilus junonius TaxID=109634 RepID=A0A9P5TLE2_GYMJU|nr:hypothetical protein CPB84DRAFT_1963550 [Gymnopilus junonius]
MSKIHEPGEEDKPLLTQGSQSMSPRPGYGLEKAHWINAVRNDPPRKAQVEEFLRNLHVMPRYQLEFRLILHLTLHYFLDKLSFFAVTCSQSTLQAMLEKIKYENEVYDGYNEKGQDYIRQLRSEQFYETEYELVVLHPKHFFPLGARSPCTFRIPMTPTASRFGGFPGPQRHSAQFGAFSGPQRQSARADKRLNPFFVILNADMAFRRFERSFPGVSLPKVYQDLLDLTRQVADQIYHVPVVQEAVKKARVSYDATKYRLQASKGAGGNNEDVDMADAGGQGGRRMAERYSRFGQAVEEPGPNATTEHLRDYARFLISGRGHEPLNSDDEAVLASIGLLPAFEGEDDEDDEEYM